MKRHSMKSASFGLLLVLMAAWLACGEDEEPNLDGDTAELTGSYNVVSISGAPLQSVMTQQAEARGISMTPTVTLDINTDGTFAFTVNAVVHELTTEQGTIPFPDNPAVKYIIAGTYVSDESTITFSSGPGEWVLPDNVDDYGVDLSGLAFEDTALLDVIGQFTGTWVVAGDNVTLDSGTGLGYFLVRQ